jgi:hypothetical protein
MRAAIVLLVGLALAGCITRQTTQFVAPPAEQKAVVWVRGDVKNRAVPWDEEMTLSRAIVAAEYTGFSDPHAISILRAGQAYKVNARDLLRQRDDPALQPGDVVVIER